MACAGVCVCRDSSEYWGRVHADQTYVNHDILCVYLFVLVLVCPGKIPLQAWTMQRCDELGCLRDAPLRLYSVRELYPHARPILVRALVLENTLSLLPGLY